MAPAYKLDEIAARISWAVFRAAGAKDVSIDDLMPKPNEPEREGSIQDVFALLSSAFKSAK